MSQASAKKGQKREEAPIRPDKQIGAIKVKKTYTKSIAHYGNFYHNTCPQCSSPNLLSGAGLKPQQESLRCSNCNTFIGYRNLEKLQKLRRRKQHQLQVIALRLDYTLTEEGGEG